MSIPKFKKENKFIDFLIQLIINIFNKAVEFISILQIYCNRENVK